MSETRSAGWSRTLNIPNFGVVDPDDGAALVHGIMQGQAAALAALRAALATAVRGLPPYRDEMWGPFFQGRSGPS